MTKKKRIDLTRRSILLRQLKQKAMRSKVCERKFQNYRAQQNAASRKYYQTHQRPAKNAHRMLAEEKVKSECFQCIGCPKFYTAKSSLVFHMKQRHRHLWREECTQIPESKKAKLESLRKSNPAVIKIDDYVSSLLVLIFQYN